MSIKIRKKTGIYGGHWKLEANDGHRNTGGNTKSQRKRWQKVVE